MFLFYVSITIGNRVIMSPVIVAGNEQNSNAGSSMEITVTVAVAEVIECLVEKTAPVANAKLEYCPVIQQFDLNCNTDYFPVMR